MLPDSAEKAQQGWSGVVPVEQTRGLWGFLRRSGASEGGGAAGRREVTSHAVWTAKLHLALGVSACKSAGEQGSPLSNDQWRQERPDGEMGQAGP